MTRKMPGILLAILLMLSLMCAGCSSAPKKQANLENATYSKTTTYNPEKERLDRYSAWLESLGNDFKLSTQGLSIPDGYTGWVVGRVSNVYFAEDSNGQPTFIDFSPKGYESTPFFTAIVWAEDLDNFNGYNFDSLVGKDVAVRGSVYTYKVSHKQVKLTSPSQISVSPV